MKRITDKITIFIILLGLLAMVCMPIYMLISTFCLKEILPDWFMITNLVLSILVIIIIAMFIYVAATDKSNSERKTGK